MDAAVFEAVKFFLFLGRHDERWTVLITVTGNQGRDGARWRDGGFGCAAERPHRCGTHAVQIPCAPWASVYAIIRPVFFMENP